ncbi:Uncharacterized protein APZ42_031418 [Daphnia magna]|uniref:HAT C-terminal dimerisation domain-containing protein n=1 Tax=Daphnia magna TaxID=35525 RepID=A0A162DBI1_9CRUS|nr:Uncharacterized protein APZ42_031418 [Daphnia magna]
MVLREVERTEPVDCDSRAVYTYWANRFCRWPCLGYMAKENLITPAISAGSERAFSVDKDVFGLIAEMDVQPLLEENADEKRLEKYFESESATKDFVAIDSFGRHATTPFLAIDSSGCP